MTNKNDLPEAEIIRLDSMMEFERKYADFKYICGIDEVGRGPLAGPVVACAVILPKEAYYRYLNDSKKVTEKRREKLYDEITVFQVRFYHKGGLFCFYAQILASKLFGFNKIIESCNIVLTNYIIRHII